MVFVGAAIMFALFILAFLTARVVLHRKSAGHAVSSGRDSAGTGLESGHDWHMRQNEQFGHAHGHHDHGGGTSDFGGGDFGGGGDSGGGGGGD